MMMKKTAITLAGLFAPLSLTCALFIAPAAQADTQTDQTAARAWLTAHDVSAVQQDVIMAKLGRNELPDASKKDSRPVSSVIVETAHYDVVTERFADGSVLVSGVEHAPLIQRSTVQPMAISGCTYTTGSGFITAQNCRIYQDSAIGTLEFKASYERYVDGSQIDSASEASFHSIYGTGSSPSLSIVASHNVGTNPAIATAHSHYTSSGGQSSEDVYLSLRVTPGSAYTTQY